MSSCLWRSSLFSRKCLDVAMVYLLAFAALENYPRPHSMPQTIQWQQTACWAPGNKDPSGLDHARAIILAAAAKVNPNHPKTTKERHTRSSSVLLSSSKSHGTPSNWLHVKFARATMTTGWLAITSGSQKKTLLRALHVNRMITACSLFATHAEHSADLCAQLRIRPLHTHDPWVRKALTCKYPGCVLTQTCRLVLASKLFCALRCDCSCPMKSPVARNGSRGLGNKELIPALKI